MREAERTSRWPSRWPRWGLLAGLVLVLGVVNTLVVQKERLVRSGTPLLLELAPVDPRALLQGDYMALRYALADTVARRADLPRRGRLVIARDTNGVGAFRRVHEPGTPLGAGEHLLRYHRRGEQVWLGAEAFFFQEGHADQYDAAAYGELVVDGDGASVLVALRDSSRVRLGTALR